MIREGERICHVCGSGERSHRGGARGHAMPPSVDSFVNWLVIGATVAFGAWWLESWLVWSIGVGIILRSVAELWRAMW
jgi:hypothetical protein